MVYDLPSIFLETDVWKLLERHMTIDLPPSELVTPDQQKRIIMSEFIIESRKWNETRNPLRLVRVDALLDSAVDLHLVPGCQIPELLAY